MAVDVDEVMTQALGVVEEHMRNSLADGFVEVLTAVADDLADADPDDAACDEIVWTVCSEEEDGTVIVEADGDDVQEAIRNAYVAGYDAAREGLRELIDGAKYTGWRPKLPDAPDAQ